MKGLLAKFKGQALKQMLIAHGEKIVLGTIGFVVLLALYSTNWTGDSRLPEDLYSKAADAGSKLNTGDMPPEKLAEFKPSTYQLMATQMTAKMNNPDAPSIFSYDKPMSFPLYARQEPRGEVTFPPVQHPLANGAVMVLAVMPPAPEFDPTAVDPTINPNGDDDDDKRRRSNKAGNQALNKADPKSLMGPGAGGPPGMPGGMASMYAGGMGMMGGAGSTGMQPRGQRYVAVTGIVNLFDTAKALQKALHLETLQEAMGLIEVIDFKIERQRAVAGENPWPDTTWQPVSLERTDEILEETGQAADIVNAGVTDPVYTMPLPSRLDGDYTEIVSHPILKGFELSPEDRKLEQQFNAALLGIAGEMGLEEQGAGKRRGFMKNTIDINSLKSNFQLQGGKMGDVYEKAGMKMPTGGMGGRGGMGSMGMAPGMGMASMGMAGRGGMGSMGMAPGMGMAGRGGQPGGGLPPMMPMGGAGKAGYGKAPGAPGMGGMPGMGMMGMGGMGMGGQMQQIGDTAVGYVMLFRFLDFDVNPGEAYRYRIQLEFANPNYGLPLDKVKEQKVADGESRFNDWSEPTAPVVIKSDTSFFLGKVDKRSIHKGEAEIQIFQWDPSLGTYIDSKKLVAKSGQFVGGLEDSDRLDLGTPSLKPQKVLFATKDFLLDTAAPPTLVPSEFPDLNLPTTGRQAKEGPELPGEIIVLDEFGQTRLLDSMSGKSDVKLEEEKVKKEREAYEYLRETEETESTGLDTLTGGSAKGGKGGKDKMMEMMMGGATSSLKRGRGGMSGMPGGGGYGSPGGGKSGKAGSMGMMPGGYGAPPTGRGGGRGGRGGK